MNPTRILSRSIAALVILAPIAASAATLTITAAGDPLNGGSGINPAWGAAANWSGAVLPGVGDIAQITYAGATRAGVDIRGSGFATNSTEVQGVSFAGAAAVEVDLENNSTGSNMTLILNGGAGTVPLIQTGTYFTQILGHGVGATTTTTKTLTVQLKNSGEINVGTGGLTLSALMTEATAGKSITKTGAGRLTMSLAATDPNNAFTGGATVSAGVLEVTANGVLGTGAIVVNGGTLEVNIASATLTNSSIAVNAGGQIATRGAVTLNNALTLNGGTLATRSADTGVFAGAINVTANSFANLRSYTTPGNSQSFTISGLLSGSSSMTINGNDPQTNGLNKALILTNTANTFSGAWNVSSAQILRSQPATTGRTIGAGAPS